MTGPRPLSAFLSLILGACGGAGNGSSPVSASTPSPGLATVWRASPTTGFRILDASIPNAGLVSGEVWLIVGTPQGMRLFRSRDGSNQSAAETIAGLANALDGTGLGPAETLPRQNASGGRELYVLGLAPAGANRSVLFRLVETGGSFVRNPTRPVFDALAQDNTGFIGVPDVYRATDGRLRLMYVDKGGPRANARTAISSDQGATFAVESANPFGDAALSGAADTNVDPAVLALSTGGYVAVTMRLAQFYIFTSADGLTFTPQATPPIGASTFLAGATGLFDPTLVQLAEGTVLLYCTMEDAQRRSSVVQAVLRLATP